MNNGDRSLSSAHTQISLFNIKTQWPQLKECHWIIKQHAHWETDYFTAYAIGSRDRGETRLMTLLLLRAL